MKIPIKDDGKMVGKYVNNFIKHLNQEE